MDTNAIIPIPDAPMVRGDRATEVWFRFFLQLFNRTGGSEGGDLTKVIRDISDLSVLLASQVPAIDAKSAKEPPSDMVAAAAIALVMSRLDELQAKIQEVGSAGSVRAEIPSEVASFRRGNEIPSDVCVHGSHDDETLHAVATPLRAGFMSASDKTKLDSL